MVIKITKGYVDFMYKGRIVRGWGDMCEKDFRIIASTVEWLFPGEKRKLNDEERSEFIEEVMKYERQTREKYKKVFEDDNGKKIKRSRRKIRK